MAKILEQLNLKFSMKLLGSAHNFLGIHTQQQNNGYFLSQKQFATSILDTANLTKCNLVQNPTCTKIPTDFPLDTTLTLYRRLTGSLQYLTLTRPDIAYSVNLLSQDMHDPSPQHAFLLKRLLRYIKDADWAGDPNSRKSTSGYCSFLGVTLIPWTVKKQHTVARSSTESEYRALTADVIWIRKLLAEFGVSQTHSTDIYCDRQHVSYRLIKQSGVPCSYQTH
ncbi:hypothetical protein KFK09_008987 [Dendrobium nobile]|uniref:Reverse transcriptase Ty1/copia-type domain-containing protein n=1 Tax=Dendrobium nobile TaxID=94219 RepID=A0A8T3BPP0_DENNO|nr:hypothetical protein KFK09_008987 [Dendrobium nobile]